MMNLKLLQILFCNLHMPVLCFFLLVFLIGLLILIVVFDFKKT